MTNLPTNEPRKRKAGGQPGNRNAARHGLLTVGKMPAGTTYIEKRIAALRTDLERAVVDKKGVVSILDAASISTALKWTRHELLSAHWLRKEGASLSPADRLRFSEATCKASAARDKAIKSLGLDAPEPSPWAVLETTAVPHVTDEKGGDDADGN